MMRTHPPKIQEIPTEETLKSKYPNLRIGCPTRVEEVAQFYQRFWIPPRRGPQRLNSKM
jgi:hypothetical protein